MYTCYLKWHYNLETKRRGVKSLAEIDHDEWENIYKCYENYSPLNILHRQCCLQLTLCFPLPCICCLITDYYILIIFIYQFSNVLLLIIYSKIVLYMRNAFLTHKVYFIIQFMKWRPPFSTKSSNNCRMSHWCEMKRPCVFICIVVANLVLVTYGCLWGTCHRSHNWSYLESME